MKDRRRRGEPMIFFVAVAVAVATVESYMAHQGYYEIDEEQSLLRAADDVYAYVDSRCLSAHPTSSFRGWPP